MQSEAPAPVAVSAPPAAVEASKAAPPAAAHKSKSRQSLSIPKGAQEALVAQMADSQPPAGRSASSSGSATGSLSGLSLSGTSAVAGSGAGSHQGLPQGGSPPSALRELPALRDAPPNKREELFKLKLQLCGVIFSFDDPTSDKRGKVCDVRSHLSFLCFVGILSLFMCDPFREHGLNMWLIFYPPFFASSSTDQIRT